MHLSLNLLTNLSSTVLYHLFINSKINNLDRIDYKFDIISQSIKNSITLINVPRNIVSALLQYNCNTAISFHVLISNPMTR